MGLAPFSGELFARAHTAGLVTLARASSASRCGAPRDGARLLDGLELQTQPSALHVWLHLPTRWSSAEAALALARTGVLVTPADRFFIGRGNAPQALRVSLAAAPTRSHLRGALERIAGVLAPDAWSGASGSLV